MCLCLGAVLAAGAAEPRDYPCYRLANAPVLSGPADQAAWAGVPEASGFGWPGGRSPTDAAATSFKMGWWPDALYVLVRCREPLPVKVCTQGTARGAPWNDDGVELCFLPPGARIQYIANAAGDRWQARGLAVRQDIPGAWEVVARKGKDEWTVAMRIPFVDFNRTPLDQERWPFSVARNVPCRSPEQSANTVAFGWMGDYDGLVFHDTELKVDAVTGVERQLAGVKTPLVATFTEAMEAGLRAYTVVPPTALETQHPYRGPEARNLCEAKRWFAAAAVLATQGCEQAQALLQLGHTLYAMSGRWPVDMATRPNRAYARSLYERVVQMPGALPETRAKAQAGIVKCHFNVGEFDQNEALVAACTSLLAMPGAEPGARLEALWRLADVAIMAQDFALAKRWCAQAAGIRNGDASLQAQARTRWAALDNWERMKTVPREVFNRDYAREALDSAVTNVLPSIGWAKPGPGAPLQVLVMCYADGVREVGEVAQRMDIEPAIVTTVDRERFGEKQAESYADGAVGYAVAAARKQQTLFEDALDRTNAIMIVAEVNWRGMPLPVREKILEKVAEGTPLIVKTSHSDDLLKAATTNRMPTGLECVYPFSGLPAFAGYPDRQAWQDGVIERYRHGQGDIWVLKGFAVPDYQLLTPGPAGMAGNVKLVEYDYYLALIVHLIREAGGVERPVRVRGQDAWAMARGAMQPVAFRLASDVQTNVTCVWTVRDRENRIALAKQEPLALKAGETEVHCNMGNVSGGEYFVDLQVKRGDNVLDFGSAFVTVTAPNRIAAVEVGNEIGRKERVKGTVQLVLSGARQGLTVRIRRRDNYRRVVGETLAKVTGETVAFTLPSVDPLTAVQAVDVELKQGDDVLDRRTVSFRIHDFVEADRHAVLPKGAGAGSYLAEYLAAGYERAGVGRVLNNVVTELLNVSSFSDGGVNEFRFENPRAGWIYVAGEVDRRGEGGEAWVWVGTAADSCTMLEWNKGADRQQETMRYLEPGSYRVFAGTRNQARFDRLMVRTVPEVCLDYHPYPSVAGVRAQVDWDYLRKHVLKSVNTIQYVCLSRGGSERMPPIAQAMEWKAGGGKWFAYSGVFGIYPQVAVPTVAEVYRDWTVEDLGMGYVDGLVCDEFTIAHLPRQREKFEVYMQAIRRINGDTAYRGKTVYPWIGLGYARYFRSVLRQLAETGNKALLERYLSEAATRDDAVRDVTQFFDLEVAPFLEVLPQPQRHFLQAPCAGMMKGTFNCDIRPDVNFKVFLDMQYNYLVNAPASAGLYGFDLYDFNGADEETVRWLGRLFRHYFIEGRRDLLSTDPYELKHIENGDFAEGLRAWTTTMPEPGGIKAATYAGMAKLESREYLGELPGADDCVSMRRSAKGPNRLTQTVRQLERGRLYSVAFYTLDVDKKEPGRRHAVAVDIAGGEIVRPGPDPKIVVDWNWHFLVFRAQASTAVLTLSDWAEASAPGGTVGQELLYDFVQVQPYLCE